MAEYKELQNITTDVINCGQLFAFTYPYVMIEVWRFMCKFYKSLVCYTCKKFF